MRLIIRLLVFKSRVFLEKFSSNTTARISRTRAFSSFAPIQLSCSRPTKSKGLRELWRCWIFRWELPVKIDMKRTKIVEALPCSENRTHIAGVFPAPILWTIQETSVGAALIRRSHHLPFYRQIHLKNIDDNGQIATLVKKKQESFCRDLY